MSPDCCCNCGDTTSAPKPTPRARPLGTRWDWRDRLGAWAVRWGFRRMAYRAQPGLYRVGTPDASSPVLVTANYKLTLDVLRRTLTGRDLWILVLNTHGVNVWCAAGKGTFGTDELVKRIKKHKLDSVVDHGRIILPQLGAPGVAAHSVKQATGFTVIYGPVRAADIPHFLDNNMASDPAMRQVTFTLRERLAVIPVELVQALKYAAPPLLLTVLAALVFGGSHTTRILMGVAEIVGAILVGTVIFPVLLAMIPIRSFTVGGLLLGLIYATALLLLVPASAGWQVVRLLVMPPVTAWLALNFTGATTFTSLSGVALELKRSVIPLCVSVLTGILVGIGFLLKGWLS